MFAKPTTNVTMTSVAIASSVKWEGELFVCCVSNGGLTMWKLIATFFFISLYIAAMPPASCWNDKQEPNSRNSMKPVDADDRAKIVEQST